jgi:O-antigen/teichoic acid export membrane protein
VSDPLSTIQPTTRGLLRRLGTNSGIYAVGNALARGTPLLLVPVFTRVLTPGDYGTLAIATAVGGLLSIVFLLSLDSAITTMYFQCSSDQDRAQLNASLLFVWLIGSGALALALDFAGRAGFLSFAPSVPFIPYLRTVLWTSYLLVFVTALQTLYATQERTLYAVGVGLVQMVITIATSVYLVVVLRAGAEGSLLANFIAAACLGAFALYKLARISVHLPSVRVMGKALGFSLPLVPHVGAVWILSLSDRTVLQHFVSAADVGIYTLGYQIASVVTMVTQGISFAFFPVFNAQIGTEDGRARVATLGTYAMLATIGLGLMVALLGGDLLKAITPAAYHGGARVVPWVAFGCTLQGVYLILSRGTWYSMRTGWVPFITSFAAAVNVALNLLFIPRFGYMAAAVNTAAAFAVLAILHGYLAHKVFPVAWQYDRWAKLGVAAGATLLIGLSLPINSLLWGAIARAVVLVLVFPVVLMLVKFVTPGEWSAIRSRFRMRIA